MTATNYIVIPKTNIRLYDGDEVTISNRPHTKWHVHKGWYDKYGVKAFGWYLISDKEETLPVEIIDLTLCSLVTKKVEGSVYCDGVETNYSVAYTDYDAEMLGRAFISVDTITQRDNLDTRKIPNGKLVRVNDYGGSARYYAWNITTKQWDDVNWGSGGDKEVFYGTTEYWNTQPQLISIKGGVYVYSDHDKDSEGKDIAGLKIGDGTSYLIDMPFVDEKYAQHVLDTIVHITQQEREFWNNKVRCYIDPKDTQHLIFTTK